MLSAFLTLAVLAASVLVIMELFKLVREGTIGEPPRGLDSARRFQQARRAQRWLGGPKSIAMQKATREMNELHTRTTAGERLVLTKDVHGHIFADGVPVLHMRRGEDGVALSSATHTFVISADDYTRLIALPAPEPGEAQNLV